MGDSLQCGCHNIYAPTIVRNVPRFAPRFDSRSRTIALYARQLHGHAANKLTRGGLKDPADLGRVGGYGPAIVGESVPFERVALLFHRVSGRLGTTAKYHRYRLDPLSQENCRINR